VAITVIVSFALYRFTLYVGFGMWSTSPFLFAYAFCFVAVAGWVLTIAFVIYVFNWLRETRVLLREIAANTRAPKVPSIPPEQRSQATWPPPPMPRIPPEEAKYMPKG
jgi:hypothetical protein